MNKTISINLGGRNFFIEEEAYRKLETYLNAIKARFAQYPGSAEIVADMEARIGEKFSEKYENNSQAVITLLNVDDLIKELGTVEDIAGEEGKSGDSNKNNYNNKDNFAPKRLMRNGGDKIIAGVCSGLAVYFDIDPIIFRAVFVILIFAWGAIIPIYFVLWLIMPEAKTATEKMEMRGMAFNLDSISETIRQRSREFKEHVTNPKNREEWKKWGEDMSNWDTKKEDKEKEPEVKPEAPDNVKQEVPVSMPEPVIIPKQNRGGFGNFLRQIFKGLGRIIMFIFVLLRKIIGFILTVSFASAIAGVTVAFAAALFNSNSPYIGLPVAAIPHTAVFYLLLVLAYMLVIFPLIFLLLLAVKILDGRKGSGLGMASGFSLFGVWVFVLIIAGAVGPKYVPQYVELEKNSPQLQTVTKNFDASGFENLDLSNSMSYKLIQGKDFSVKATGWAMGLDRISVSINNGTLKVSRSGNPFCIFCVIGHTTVEITAPEFTSIKAENSSDIQSDLITATTTSLSLENSSEANIHYEVKELVLNLSNSSDANLNGTADTLTAKLSNSSDLSAKELLVKNADVATSNSSDANINISDTLKYSSFNSSRIYYIGSPQIIPANGTELFENRPVQENP